MVKFYMLYYKKIILNLQYLKLKEGGEGGVCPGTCHNDWMIEVLFIGVAWGKQDLVKYRLDSVLIAHPSPNILFLFHCSNGVVKSCIFYNYSYSPSMVSLQYALCKYYQTKKFFYWCYCLLTSPEVGGIQGYFLINAQRNGCRFCMVQNLYWLS